MFKKLEDFEIHDLLAIRGGKDKATEHFDKWGCKLCDDTLSDDNNNGTWDNDEEVCYFNCVEC